MRKFNECMKRHDLVYPSSKELYLEFCDDFSENVTSSLKRQFVFEETHTPMRLSSLGKTPAFELLGKKLGLISMGGKNTVNEQLRMIFTLGDWVEFYCLFLLKRLGYTIVDTQRIVTWHGVDGHTDAVIRDENGDEHLLEIKSSNDWYFKSVVNQTHPGDERGYLTQLLTYSDATGIPRSNTHWVFFNKNSCEMQTFDLSNVDPLLAEARLNRAKSIAKAYAKCTSTKELYTMVQPPPPKIEKTRDGKFVLDEHGEIKLYSPPEVGYPEFCYKIKMGLTKWGKKRAYVVDYNYPEEFQASKPDIKKMALAHD